MTNCYLCHSRISATSWSSIFLVDEPDPICQMCENSLELIIGDRCAGCSRPFSSISPEYRQGDICYDCIRWQEDPRWGSIFHKNHSIYLYNEFLKQVISLYKFRGDYVVADIFRQIYKKSFKQHFQSTSLIVPIPLSPERLYERGFNQSIVFAQFLNLPIHDILARTHLEKQSKKSRTARIQSENVFSLQENTNVFGKEIVLIDDIYTTGTTIRHAAEVLSHAGAKTVSSFTLARG